MITLGELGRVTDIRLLKTVSSIGLEAIARSRWRTAETFLNLEIDITRRIHDNVHLAEALWARATVRIRSNDFPGARADIRETAAAISGVADAAYRANLSAQKVAVDAQLATTPAESVTLL